MGSTGYKRFLENVQSFRQQVNALIDHYKQYTIEVNHLTELKKEWVKLEQLYVHERNILDQMTCENFTAVTHAMNGLFQLMKKDCLYGKELDAWQLVATYLQQVNYYLQAIEKANPKKTHTYPPSTNSLKQFEETKQKYCHKLKDLLNQDASNNKEELLNLKKQWHELNQYYDTLIQDGFCVNESFEKARSVYKTLYEKGTPVILINTYIEQLYYYLDEVKDFQHRKDDMKAPFLVDLWTWTLQKLEMLSVFYIIRNVLFPEFTKRNFRFVDSWLFGHTLLALLYVCIANLEWIPIAVKYALLIYGCLRMFEILIYQLNVILVHPYNTVNYTLNSYRRMTIALIHNFIEIIFWFAGTFITLQFITDSTVPLAVYTSFTHMVTYSMELDDSKWTMLTIVLLQFQAAIGVFMTVLSLARFVSLFPQPASTDLKEQEANEVRHAKLMEEICLLKIAVDSNSKQISANKEEIEQIQKEQVK